MILPTLEQLQDRLREILNDPNISYETKLQAFISFHRLESACEEMSK